jgi:hydroxyacylglutathione hydrolase
MAEIIPIHMLMVNAFLLKGDRLMLVDTGVEAGRASLLKKLAKLGVAPADLSLAIHTHLHVDHTGSSQYLQQQGVKLAVHAAECHLLEQGRSAPVTPRWQRDKTEKHGKGGTFPAASVDIVVEDSLDLHPYGIDGEVIHTPGHSPGSVSVIVRGKDGIGVVAGDLLIGGFFGFFNPRTPRRHMIINNLEQMRASIDRVLSYSPAQVYLGHGGPISGPVLQNWFNRQSWK